jgi:hypothetical protein
MGDDIYMKLTKIYQKKRLTPKLTLMLLNFINTTNGNSYFE